MVPLVGSRKAIFALQGRGQGNSLRAHTALANKLDLRDFTGNCLELEPSDTWGGKQQPLYVPAHNTLSWKERRVLYVLVLS
jgi:hypothetical protein